MPTYTIQGKRITTEQTLTDAQIDEIAADLARAATKPANETAVTVQPTTLSMPLEDTNLCSAVTSALIGTAVGILAAILLHWLITRHLWRKPRLTPHQNGLWCGSLLASLSLGMGVGGLVNIAYGFTLTRADWDKYGIGWSVVLPPVYFIVGYAMGQVFRRLKPLVGKAAVEAPANVPAPSRTPSAPSHETTNLGQTSSPVVAHSSTYSNLKPIVTTSEDEAIYEQALTELSANKKPGLWAMALAQTANGGNPDGVYIALRVEQLRVERSEQQQDQSAIHTENRNVVSEEKKSAIRAAEALARIGDLRKRLRDHVDDIDAHARQDALKLAKLCGYDVRVIGGSFMNSEIYEIWSLETNKKIVTLSSVSEFVEWTVKSLCKE